MGNGHNIQIWKDKWLPTPSTHKVIFPPSCLPLEAWVEELIDQDNGVWKNELVQQIFLPHEADAICGIALSANLPVDKHVWASMANGIFSVRSAYKIVVEMGSGDEVGAMLDDSNLRKFWKYLGQFNVPHKVRHFTWRACKDILPTKENLVKRKVLVDSCCEECQVEVESSGHLFWESLRDHHIWSLSNLFHESNGPSFNSFMDMMWYVVMEAQWEQSHVEKVIMVAWAIWTNRYESKNGGVKKNSWTLLQWSLDHL